MTLVCKAQIKTLPHKTDRNGSNLRLYLKKKNPDLKHIKNSFSTKKQRFVANDTKNSKMYQTVEKPSIIDSK